MRHRSNSSYGRIRVASAESWFLRKNGLLETSYGMLRPSRVLQAHDGVDPEILPAVLVSDKVAEALGMKTSTDDLSVDDWVKLKSIADSWADDDRRNEFYSWLPGHIDPAFLMVRVGRRIEKVEIANIGVTADRAVYESMLESQVPALFAPTEEDSERFRDLWGMRDGTELLQEEIAAEPAGEPFYLVDAFPPLKLWLPDIEMHDLMLQPAVRIVKMMATQNGQISRPIPARRDGTVLFVTARTSREQLEQVSTVLQLGLAALQIDKILAQMEATAHNERRAKIRAAFDDDSRLVEAVGVEALRRIVPEQALKALGGIEAVSPVVVAALARSVHGVSILKQLRPALEEAGLQPPKEWAGRRLTRDWVASLGFPLEWSGFPAASRPAVEVIDGPAVLEPLHEYQHYVTDKIKALLLGVGPDRGVVSLPTGAGKTRVTVEALVNGIRDEVVTAAEPLIWIAQSDELCEQAAETWTYVWRAIGPRIAMRLGRLWGSNEVPEEPGVFQLIIATIDKLHAISERKDREYEWVRSPSIVVVDEAHASITASYTAVLQWLGRSARDRGERKPLIGLTATPFRGTSDEETRRLVNRYDSNRLDRGAFLREDPYEELQAMGVLARVEQRIIDGVDVELTSSDIAEIAKTRRLPGQVSDAIGADLARTKSIVESIASLPDDWTVLAFTPSVENARVLAALLSHRGIAAVSISADTDMAARRHYIRAFKAGQIRVLTNFNVLTQGFDAPQVQAVYVARPTFSPNVYQQMIGRGLRGPLNGGSDAVLIVNVRDNFAQYGDLLAFKQFEYLWNPRAVRA